MDLLTSNGAFRHSTARRYGAHHMMFALGWLPSYTIPAVLMQIKLAISNLEPRPARLASDWQRWVSFGRISSTFLISLTCYRPYGVQESLEGFRRAAATHGWTVSRFHFHNLSTECLLICA